MIDYSIHILIMIGIYIILSVSQNLISGYSGIISLAHAAFYGLGAYISVLLTLNVGTPFLFNLLVAVLLSSIIGGLVGVPSLRIRGDYLVVATFAFQVIFVNLLSNLKSITGGVLGIPAIPNPKIFSIIIDNRYKFIILVYVFVVFVIVFANIISKSSFGRVLKGIREDEIFCLSLGKDVAKFKIIIFMIGSGLAAISGTLYAGYISYIDPSTFTFMESILIISMIIIGGVGSIQGSVLGACLLVLLPELIRFVGLPSTIAPNIRQMFYGACLVIFLFYRPQGLLGNFSFNKMR